MQWLFGAFMLKYSLDMALASSDANALIRVYRVFARTESITFFGQYKGKKKKTHRQSWRLE